MAHLYKDLGVILADHTVNDDATGTNRLVAGFAVRTMTGRDMGFVWTVRGVWNWRSPSGKNFGERRNKYTALVALRDAFNHHDASRGLRSRAAHVVESTDRPTAPQTARRVESTDRPKTATASQVAAPVVPVVQVINWGAVNNAGLSDAVAAAFKKHGAK
jgi:hypothetical protein